MISKTDSNPQDSTTKEGTIPSSSQVDFIIGINQKEMNIEDPKLQFFVKYKNKKYLDCSWISKTDLESIPGFKTDILEPFEKICTSILSPVTFVSSLYKPDQISFDKSFLIPEEILSNKKINYEDVYLIKWENLGIEQSTWEDNKDECIPNEMIETYKNSKKRRLNPISNQSTESFQNPSQFIPFFESPEYKNANKLTTNQLDGLNWLIDKWYNNRNSILADEHGNGKTVQCIAFTEEINKLTGYFGPYLVITSLSSVNKWKNEFEKWTNLRVIEFIGNEKELEILQNYVLFNKSKTFIKYDVIITSIKIFSENLDVFSPVHWICIFVDKLLPKHLQNPIFEKIDSMTNHLILIIDEDLSSYPITTVYSIFHLIDSETFFDLEMFIQNYSDDQSTVNFEQLKFLNLEYFLRRDKPNINPFDSDFIKKQDFLNEKEIVIEAEPSLFQLELYRNYFLDQKTSFIFNEKLEQNLFTLRKIANHPFLLKKEFRKFQKESGEDEEKVKTMISLSGKMVVLDRLLEKFKSMNQRVLILSNMIEMVDLIELYLQKKNFPYNRLDGSNGEINKTHKNGEESFCFLSSIKSFGNDFSKSDTAIIYDSHFTPISLVNKTNIYRLITRGTVEEDLFIKFTIKKNFSPETKKDVDFMMRRTGYFAFYGQIDVSFFSEPIEKTIEYRTNFDITNPDGLDDKNFWMNLFKNQDLKKLEEIKFDTEKLKLISKSIMNYGCFETQNQYQHESNCSFLIVCLVYYLYKSIEKEKRTAFKYYIQKVSKISKEIIVSKEVIQKEPFINDFFIHHLFGKDLINVMLKIFSIDRIFICLSFLSTNKINQIGFLFGQSMNIPTYWNDFYDYTLLYTSCMTGMNQSNIKVFAKNLEKIGIPVGYLPLSMLSFQEKFGSSQINLPEIQWLKNRISLIVSEMELIIPEDFFPSVHPMTPIEWINFYRPNVSIHLETKSIIKRVLRFLYLFGFPAKRNNGRIDILKKKMMLESIPNEIITAIIYSLIKSAANLVMPNKDAQNSKEVNRSKFDILTSLIRDIKPIRIIDVSWVNKDALLSLTKHLILFEKVRELSDVIIKKNRNEIIELPKWTNSPSWWSNSHSINFIQLVDSNGFVYLSSLKNLKEIYTKLSADDKEEIKNYRIYEKKMLGNIKCEVPYSLKEISFLKKIEVRSFILQKLISYLLIPSIDSISKYLHVNQMAGLIIIDIGSKNIKGFPIGYHSIRFYRGTKRKESIQTPTKNSFNMIQKNSSLSYSLNALKLKKSLEKSDDTVDNPNDYTYYSFLCILKSEQNGIPLFIIRNHDNNPSKFFQVSDFSINQVYKKFKDTLICKGIELPPPYFDGYEFFGFKNKFVGSYISIT